MKLGPGCIVSNYVVNAEIAGEDWSLRGSSSYSLTCSFYKAHVVLS